MQKGSLMGRNHPKDPDNIYRQSRLERFSSQEKAAEALSAAGFPVSASSLKGYENGDTIPPADAVAAMAETYGTPQLKWAHCHQQCPLGASVVEDPPTVVDNVYYTLFNLNVAFDQIDDVKEKLRAIVADDRITEDEKPLLDEVFDVLGKISENALELRLWVERQRQQR